MKVALVSFGHADSAIPMAKYISDRMEIDLFFTFSLGMRKNNVVNFENIQLKTGLQSNEIAEMSFSNEVKRYSNNKFRLGIFIYRNLKLKSLANWVLSWKYARLLRKYDLIHFNGKNLCVFQLRIFLPFKKFVFTIHDLENHTGEEAKNSIARAFNKIIIKAGYHSVIQNKSDYNWLLEKYPGKQKNIHFIPFGNLEIYKQYDTGVKQAPGCDLLFFGRISPYKGIEYFIEAVEMLKELFPRIKAIIAGSGKFYFDTKAIENNESFIILNKFIESDELVALIKASKMVVCPYTDATQSGVAMTSFVFNKPVIATNTGGFKDVIVDGFNGYLVPVKNAKVIFEKVRLLLENPGLLEQMKLNIGQQSEDGEFSWKSISKKYEEVYKSALKNI